MNSTRSQAKQELTSPKSYLTPTEVASLLMVSPHTVRKWVKKGWLAAEHTPGGHRRFLRHNVEGFARDRGLTLNCRQLNVLKVLVADDDTRFCDELQARLSDTPDVHMMVASNAFETGHKLGTFAPDVILLSLDMSGLDPVQVCKQLQSEPATRAIQIIVMTQSDNTTTADFAIEAGAEHCVRKPLNWPHLFSVMGISRQALRSR